MRPTERDLLPTLCLVAATCLTPIGVTESAQAQPPSPAQPPSVAVLTIGDAVGHCAKLGLQNDPAFMRGARLELVWRSDRLARLTELTFVENGFGGLRVDGEQSFATCVRQRLEDARVLWPPKGNQRVKVNPVG